MALADRARKSGTLYLLATLDGWSAKVPVAVKVSAFSDTPKLKLSKTSVSLLADSARSQGASVLLLPAAKGATLGELGVDGVSLPKQGELIGKAYAVYKTQDLYILSYDEDSETICLMTKDKDTRPAKGPVLLQVKIAGATKPVELKLGVSVTKANSVLKLTPAKKTVTFSGVVKAGEGTTIALKPSIPDFKIGQDDLKLTVTDAKGTPFETDIPLSVTADGLMVGISTNSFTKAGTTYKVKAVLPGSNSVLVPAKPDASATITVKTLAASKTPKVSVVVKGNLDLSRPGNYTTFTTRFTNFGGAYAESQPFTILLGDTDVTGDFEFNRLSSNQWRVSLGDGPPMATGRYSVLASGSSAPVGGITISNAKATTMTVIASKPKVTASTKALTLYRSKPYSGVHMSLSVPEGWASIDSVEIIPTKAQSKNPAKLHYKLTDLKNGSLHISFKDANTAVSQTLTLGIRLSGNKSESPVATVRVKVVVR